VAVSPAEEGLPTKRAAALSRQLPQARWLVRDLWGAGAVGILGGAPKSCKSWLGLEIATAVAAGVPCLGHFPTERSGTVVAYLAEDALPMVRGRIASICEARGVSLAGLDLHVITAPSLRIDREGDQRKLRVTLARLRPQLLVLDPLVRLHALDENSARDVSGLLGYLRELQREYDVAILLVHHARKRTAQSPGESLRGSGDLHAWTDVTAHLAKREDGDLRLRIEHRAAASPPEVRLRLTAKADGTAVHLEVLDGPVQRSEAPRTLTAEVEAALVRRGGGPAKVIELREELRVRKERVGQALEELREQGRVRRLGAREGWKLLPE
jgi:hypothetical protein